MKKNILSVTIGIPAHNEEKGIANLIKSIFSQSQRNFSLSTVIVVCDGCTDNTALVAKTLAKKYKKIHLINDGKRKGKSARLNEIFKLNDSDVLVCIDADVKLAKNNINWLAKAFDNPRVGLVGGCDLPTAGHSFAERVSISWINHWQKLVRPVNNFDNPTNCPGRIYALSKAFVKSFHLPSTIVADDHYIYYMAKKNNLEFRFEPKAIAYFRAPVSLHDYIKQSIRFGKSGDEVKEHFGKITCGYSKINTIIKIKTYISSLLNEPIYFTVALSLQLYIRLKYSFTSKTYSKGQWESIEK